MTWIALRALFGGMFSKLWTWLSSLSFWQLVCGGLAIFATIQHFEIIRARHEAVKWHKQYAAEHHGRISDRAAYIKAQADAAAKNEQQIARVKQQQKDISDAQVSHLGARLQLISDELRKQTDAAAQRPPASAQAGDASAAPCRAVSPAWLCLSPADRLLAAQNEERHDELIDWVIAQSKVDPNK